MISKFNMTYEAKLSLINDANLADIASPDGAQVEKFDASQTSESYKYKKYQS